MKTLLPYWLIAPLLLVVGCQRSELWDQSVPEGADAQIELTLNADSTWNEVATKTSGLPPAQEGQIKSLEMLVFNSAQQLVSRHRLENPSGLTHTIATPSGSAMSIYVVTNTSITVNGNGTPNDVLGMANTVSALKNIKVTNLLVDAATNQTLIMCGVATNVTISPSGNNPISIPLDYVAAKVTVNVRSSLPVGESFELSDWKLGSLARYSYIFPQATDAVNPANAADFVTQSTGNGWDDGTIDVAGVPTPVKTTTFYVFENRRGTTTNADPKLKSGATAPAAATQFLARGYYKTLISVKAIDIKVMLGANSTNNYNIERCNRYVYNIEVKGFNDIAIETRYKEAGVGFAANLVNSTLDAHYDLRPIQVGAYLGTSTLTILDENGNPTNSSFWLKVSAKDITHFVNNGSGTYIRPTYNPATEMLQTISYTHTNLTGMEFKMFYLYADEFLTDNGTRTAKVVVSNLSGGSTPLTPITYTITQRGALMAGRVGMRQVDASGIPTSTDYVLATEIYEEATMAITPNNLANERTSTMQWGLYNTSPSSSTDYTRRNGLTNTQNLVLSNIAAGTLRTPYGRTGDNTINHRDYDPIYNTYAARYCFEKNRDTNGDGVIKGDEIKWYLPSPDEQLLIYAAAPSLSTSSADLWTPGSIYLSSSQSSSDKATASTLWIGQTATVPDTQELYVRCVRQITPTP